MRLRNALALVLLLATALACVELGRWQLRRADERMAVAQAIAAGQKAAPVCLNAVRDVQDAHPAQTGSVQEQGRQGQPALQAWQPARARGRWLDAYSVLLDNRNLQGRPGLWLATPLLLDGGEGGTGDVSVLVLRGWLSRSPAFSPDGVAASMGRIDLDAQHLPDPNPDPLRDLVQGHLRNHVPRLYELWQRGGRDTSALPQHWPLSPMPAARPPVVQNLALDRYAQATGLTLLPVVLVQENTRLPDGLIRQWEPPSVDADKNRGYALQWFSFATIALIAALGLLGRMLGRVVQRRRGRQYD